MRITVSTDEKESRMAILMILEWQGVTADDYERVNALMGIRSDADAPEGLLVHTAAVDDSGDVIVADLWESEAALGRFTQAQLMPALQQAGLPAAEPRMFTVPNRLRGKSPDASVLTIVELEGATTDDYDRLAAEMPDEHTDGSHPSHEHVAASDGETLIVVDQWPSLAAFNAFIGSRVAKAAETTGADMSSMRVRTPQVHNRIRGEARTTA
jgi:heme-degrading monooxygenase HmoA